MHNSFFKNFLLTSAMIMFSFILIGSAFGYVSRKVFLSETRESMLNSASEISQMIEADINDDDLYGLHFRMTLTAIASSTNQHIFIIDPDGYVVSCSDKNISCHHIGTRLKEESISSLSGTQTTTLIGSLDDFYEEPRYIVAAPLISESQNLDGFLILAKDVRSALYIWQTILPLFFIISAVVLLFALISNYISSQHLAKPILELTETARKFGMGDLSARINNPGRDDEVGELIDAFNSMASSLEKAEERRSNFIANVSHELKTPMTTISGFADGILDGTIPHENEKKYLTIISSETKRLARLVRSMLELSRLQTTDRSALLQKSFDISELMRLTLINFADKIEEKDLDVDFQVPDDSILVLGDKDAITQVIYNLLDNAIKFSHRKTVLQLSLWKNDSKAFISVKNHGNTIPESEIPLLFDRFHKTDRSRSHDKDGVGLGLYIVKTILNNHGEDIAVTSRQGKTDFVFTLTIKQ